MKRDGDPTERLRREITRAIVLQTGTREQIAMSYAEAVVAYLQQEYAGRQVYIPARPRQYDVLQIEAALRQGMTSNAVCREFGLSLRTLYKMFPGGLPKPAKAG